MTVFQHDRADPLADGRCDIQPPGAHQAPGKGEPLGTVMVARCQDDGDTEISQQSGQEVIHRHRGRYRRHRAVIQITADADHLCPDIPGNGNNLIKDMGLIISQLNIMDDLAQMQISKVQNTHGTSLRRKTGGRAA